MSEPYLAEVRIVSFNFPPKGWAMCNGQLMPINQNQALFSILGTTYGGDGRTTFALPDLRCRVPLHAGAGVDLGQSAGEATHTLATTEMPAHNHLAGATSAAVDSAPAAGNLLGRSVNPVYAALSSPTALSPLSVANAGGSQPHENMQPYLVLTFIIALQGIFPSRN